MDLRTESVSGQSAGGEIRLWFGEPGAFEGGWVLRLGNGGKDEHRDTEGAGRETESGGVGKVEEALGAGFGGL